MTHAMERRRVVSATALGMVLALLAFPIYRLFIDPLFVIPNTTTEAHVLIGQAMLWGLTLSLLAVTRFAEHKSLASVGIKPLSWRRVAVAVGLGLLLLVAVWPLSMLASQLFPITDSGGISENTSGLPAWIVLFAVVTAGVTEEMLFRAYPIERFQERTGNLWFGALVSLAAFVVMHNTGWNLGWIIGVVLPLGATLTGIYLWQRNLIFVIIIHIIVDLPLFFFALTR